MSAERGPPQGYNSCRRGFWRCTRACWVHRGTRVLLSGQDAGDCWSQHKTIQDTVTQLGQLSAHCTLERWAMPHSAASAAWLLDKSLQPSCSMACHSSVASTAWGRLYGFKHIVPGLHISLPMSLCRSMQSSCSMVCCAPTALTAWTAPMWPNLPLAWRPWGGSCTLWGWLRGQSLMHAAAWRGS